MEIHEIRLQMESLWKENFGDSSEYIKLIFDNYFTPDNAVFQESEGRIVAGLLMVPYRFVSRSGAILKGAYLCGLSTVKDRRRQGIMTELLKNASERLKARNFDFSFLIPQDESVRRYYRKRGFSDAFYKLKEFYVKDHVFLKKGSELNVKLERVLSDHPLQNARKGDFINFLIHNQAEKSMQHAFRLQHDVKDWDVVITEAIISEEPIYVAKDTDRIVAACFVKKESSEPGMIEVKKIITADDEYEKALLEAVKRQFKGEGIILNRDADELQANPPSPQIWSPFFGSSNDRNAEYADMSDLEQPFNQMLNAHAIGMIDIFDVWSLMQKSGIDTGNFPGYSDDQMRELLLRRPAMEEAGDTLNQLLDMPEISFSISLLLE